MIVHGKFVSCEIIFDTLVSSLACNTSNIHALTHKLFILFYFSDLMNTLLKFSKYKSFFESGFQNSSILACTNVYFNQQNRTTYSFSLSNRQLIRYRRTTRPKKTNDDSIMLTYEQAQFVENLGLTKSWATWNTCIYKINL
jgi:hypothetical protein